jgi:hypothetical protein
MGETQNLLMPWAIVRDWEELIASFCLCKAPATDNHFFFSPTGHTKNGPSIYSWEVQPAGLDKEMEPAYANKKGRELALLNWAYHSKYKLTL